jgi:hypothetical protein
LDTALVVSTKIIYVEFAMKRVFMRLGRYVFDLAFDNVIQVAATSHPSQLKVPDDLQKLLTTSRSPLLINTSEVDQQYPIASQLKGDEILGGGKYKPGYQKM